MKPVQAIDTDAIMRVSLRTPSIPNFIRTDDGRAIPVQDLDDKVLRALAKNWTALLLLSARNKRKRKERP